MKESLNRGGNLFPTGAGRLLRKLLAHAAGVYDFVTQSNGSSQGHMHSPLAVFNHAKKELDT